MNWTLGGWHIVDDRRCILLTPIFFSNVSAIKDGRSESSHSVVMILYRGQESGHAGGRTTHRKPAALPHKQRHPPNGSPGFSFKLKRTVRAVTWMIEGCRSSIGHPISIQRTRDPRERSPTIDVCLSWQVNRIHQWDIRVRFMGWLNFFKLSKNWSYIF